MDLPVLLDLRVLRKEFSMTDSVRAWKDPAFRATLAESDLAALADNPAGLVGGPDTELADIIGGDHRPFTFHSCFTCAWGSFGCVRATCYPGGPCDG